MAFDDEARALKLAANQSRFRRSNDRLKWAAESHRFEMWDRLPFLCECGDAGCFEEVMLDLVEYERVRAHPTWFVLVAGHEYPETSLERIVDAENGYAVVEKIGIAGEVAERTNQRLPVVGGP